MSAYLLIASGWLVASLAATVAYARVSAYAAGCDAHLREPRPRPRRRARAALGPPLALAIAAFALAAALHVEPEDGRRGVAAPPPESQSVQLVSVR